jgi:hypothetical protein
MRAQPRWVLAAAAVAGLVSAPLAGQATAAMPASHTHIGHIADMFNGTPQNKGFYATAVGEADVLITHAGLMAGATTNLNTMKTHAGHIINAIDPTQQPQGPGLGYGLKKALDMTVQHIDLAAKATGASANVTTHAAHISISSQNTLKRTDQILTLAKQIQAATDAAAAATLVGQLKTIADQLKPGVAGPNGRVGPVADQGGLDTVGQHIQLVKTAEGMPF